MVKNRKKTTKIKKITVGSFTVGKRYQITWKNLGKQVTSIGSVLSTTPTKKFICIQEDKLNAATIVPVDLILSYKFI